MKKIKLLLCSGLLAGGAFGVGHLVAQDKNLKDAKAPAMTPEMEQMMQAMMQKAAPGPEHQRLAKLAGRWKFDVKAWDAPGMDPHTSSGASNIAPVMGGRFILQQVNGDWAGMPFEGMSTMGYDKFKKHFVSTWIDNMTTSIAMFTGTHDAAKNQFVMTGEMFDPKTDKMTKFREVTTINSDNKYTTEMFTSGPDGKEFKCMELVYTRM